MMVIKRIAALFILATLAVAAGAQPTKSAPAQGQPAAQPVPRTQFISNMDAEFKRIDADNDGVATQKEVDSFQRTQAFAQARAYNQRLFGSLDSDHNNVLTAAEFSRLPANLPAPNPFAMIQRFDINHDGKISLVEFRSGKLVNFDRLDADKDGLVSAAEMKAGGIVPK